VYETLKGAGAVSYRTVSPSRSAVVLFDMLNYAVRRDTDADRARLDPVVANCMRLRAAAESAGMPSFFAKADHRPDGRDIGERYSDVGHDMQPWPDPEQRRRPHTANVAGSRGADVIDELRPTADDDYVVPKHRWSAFFQTHLELSLRSRRIDTIVLCGGATEIGIASTAYAARDLDFDLVVVRDATTTSRPAVHDLYMDGVFPRFARVRTTDEVLAMIERGSREEHQ
jgi:nicotinamidase-related amidase